MQQQNSIIIPKWLIGFLSAVYNFLLKLALNRLIILFVNKTYAQLLSLRAISVAIYIVQVQKYGSYHMKNKSIGSTVKTMTLLHIKNLKIITKLNEMFRFRLSNLAQDAFNKTYEPDKIQRLLRKSVWQQFTVAACKFQGKMYTTQESMLLYKNAWTVWYIDLDYNVMLKPEGYTFSAPCFQLTCGSPGVTSRHC